MRVQTEAGPLKGEFVPYEFVEEARLWTFRAAAPGHDRRVLAVVLEDAGRLVRRIDLREPFTVRTGEAGTWEFAADLEEDEDDPYLCYTSGSGRTGRLCYLRDGRMVEVRRDADGGAEATETHLAHEAAEARLEAVVRAAGHKRLRVACPDPDDLPLDLVAVSGRVVLTVPRSVAFGGPRSRDYRSEVLVDPTWLQVAVCANASVVMTRDQHHVYLEGVEETGQDQGVALYEIIMGS
jgi:hypothetical protein